PAARTPAADRVEARRSPGPQAGVDPMGRDPRPLLRIRTAGDVTIVGFAAAQLDSDATIQTIGDQLYDLIDQGRANLLLDFAGVRYATSSLLGKLVALTRRAAKAGGRVALCGVAPSLGATLAVSNLDRLL